MISDREYSNYLQRRAMMPKQKPGRSKQDYGTPRDWYAEHVHGKALVLALNPRLTFEGCTTPYPKDCILAVYGAAPGFEVWRWR